jgi:diadenosine tetraphosphate (Ap4A) HIT family hydrolase
MAFTLDHRLVRDTLPIGDLPFSRVLLMNDSTWPWIVLVPKIADASELIDLDAVDRGRLMEEIAAVATALRTVAGPTKLNVAALGNIVRQLHVHVIARFEDDPAWPGPVWGRVPPVPYEPAIATALVARLVEAMDPMPVPIALA